LKTINSVCLLLLSYGDNFQKVLDNTYIDAKGVVFMLVTKLFQFINKQKSYWFASTMLATLGVLLSSSVSLADNADRVIIPNRLTDGVSLYGEADRPDEIGKEYLILEKVGNKTIGAIYMPQSDFSCFYGRVKKSDLNITLIDGYNGQQYNYGLSLHSRGLTASKMPMMGTPTYQPLGQISDNDRRILESCKSQLQDRW
jgi:hypothetical protein